MRNIKRNILRSKYGNKAIKGLWRQMQIKKYGIDYWIAMYQICKKRYSYRYIRENLYSI